MELDDLKSIWKKQGQSFQPRNEAEITAMLNGSSRSIVAKLKRSVWLELAFTLIAGIALLVYALTLQTSPLKNISIAILVMFVGYIFYYIKKLSLLNKFNTTGKDIRTNLENLVYNLSGYLKFYRRSYTILYPVYFILGVLFGGIDRGTERFLEVLSESRTIAILITLGFVFYFTSKWVVNWLLKKLYGNHLEKLRSLLNDIRNDGAET